MWSEACLGEGVCVEIRECEEGDTNIEQIQSRFHNVLYVSITKTNFLIYG